MNNLNYGVNVEFLLYDLSHHESSDIGEFEVYGDDDSGCEGSASIDITLLAADALNIILSLKQELKVATEEVSHIKAMNDLLSEELRGYEKGGSVNASIAEKAPLACQKGLPVNQEAPFVNPDGHSVNR
ncbi:hypothetical protein V462_10460 [Pantoea ananatis 15320]|uniref:hypothetical protein n=1 Tax=Pantoea ananas TaxID=553 RepID=UPI0004655DA5|nr:hypothetical protein [Pantoea ananatis]PKC36333.1 hypothetical protein V462_10460 [Pantoea ananatis 15320]